MDDVRIGNAARLIRQRRGWRQQDLAQAADVAQGCVSKLERGQLAHLRVETIRSIARALEMEITFEARWRGGELSRLRDAEHAGLVERFVKYLEVRGWEVVPEYTFSHFGERGSVDILAWHPALEALLIIEVKGRIVDVQDLVATLDRKRRLVPRLVSEERGWRARAVATVVIATGSGANRRIVGRHGATFQAVFPGRGLDARRWIKSPVGPLAALWLVEPPGRRVPVPRRVRRPASEGS
jgi:transcriptional regulator with XRE-family HTH domain